MKSYYEDADAKIYHCDLTAYIHYTETIERACDTLIIDPDRVPTVDVRYAVKNIEHERLALWLPVSSDPRHIRAMVPHPSDPEGGSDVFRGRVWLDIWPRRQRAPGMFGGHSQVYLFSARKPKRTICNAYVSSSDAGVHHPGGMRTDHAKHIIFGWSEPDELIVDPFMGGGGTILEAAKALGRKSIGIEIDESLCEIAANRLRKNSADVREQMELFMMQD